MASSKILADQAYLALIQSLGLENHVANAQESARLSAELLGQLTSSVDCPRPHLSLIDAPLSTTDNWVVLDEIPFYSLCEHHFVPFFGTAKFEYLPNHYIAGLGGFMRVLDFCCRMPQLQERLTQQVGAALVEDLQPRALRVTLKARQMCVELRGQPAIVVETHFQFSGAEDSSV